MFGLLSKKVVVLLMILKGGKERERDLLGRTRIKEVIELVKNRFPCI